MKKLADMDQPQATSTNISVEEMMEDIKKLNDYSIENAEKKAMATKYGIQSRKAAEIEHAILVKAAEDRATRKSFTELDITMFKRLSNCPEIYGKMESFLQLEPEAFIKYMKDVYEEDIKSKGIEQYITWKPSDLKYARIKYGDKYTIKFYQFLLKYLEENGSSTKDARDVRKEATDLVLSKLNEQLKDFKKTLLDHAEEQALKHYDNIVENIDMWFEKDEECEKQLNDLRRQNGRSYRYWDTPEYKKVQETQKRWHMMYVEGNFIMNKWSKEEYGKYCREQAEKEYEMKKKTMAEKIVDRDFDYANIQFTNVKRDPKWIEMLITDGVKKVYARSIIAAEYSEKVTVHFRFILTDRK